MHKYHMRIINIVPEDDGFVYVFADVNDSEHYKALLVAPDTAFAQELRGSEIGDEVIVYNSEDEKRCIGMRYLPQTQAIRHAIQNYLKRGEQKWPILQDKA